MKNKKKGILIGSASIVAGILVSGFIARKLVDKKLKQIDLDFVKDEEIIKQTEVDDKDNA